MKLVVYSASQSFRDFLSSQLDLSFECKSELPELARADDCIHLLHISTMDQAFQTWLMSNTANSPLIIAICTDNPNILEMLECAQSGARAYCNSYMAKVHFQQMLQLLDNGQSWFPPHLLEQAFNLAHKAASPRGNPDHLETLTSREKEIALAVAEGKSNKQIASDLRISEPTVKTHLTNIFKKLELKDRVALVLHLKAP